MADTKSKAASASPGPLVEKLRRRVRAVAAHGFVAVMDDDAFLGLCSILAELVELGLPEPHGATLLKISEALPEQPAGLGRHDRTRIVAQCMRLALTLEAQRKSATATATKKKPIETKGRGKKSRSARTGAASEVGQAEPTVLQGIGPRIAERLAERGVGNVEDLAHIVPTAYVDHRVSDDLIDFVEGTTVVVHGVIRQFRQGWARGRYMASMRLELRSEPNNLLEGEAKVVDARWFHSVQGLFERVETGQSCILVGPVKRFRGLPSMVHPEVYFDESAMPAIGVRYPLVEGVSPKLLRKACTAAVAYLRAHDFQDPFRVSLRERWGLPALLDALEELHDPPPDLPPTAVADLAKGASPAHRRLAFDELFFIQLACLLERRSWRSASTGLQPLPEGSFSDDALRVCLPFEPTGAQWRCVSEIHEELTAGEPMLRLLQGDVGSGKTVVAFAAAMMCHAAGGQSVFMAPTEILADQHFRTLSAWCDKAGMKVARLTGSMRRAERNSLLALLREHKIDLVVGTHAVLVDDVDFRRLGLVIVDEQHRFGVDQRAALRAKGDAPHLLVMTATPIPRSLAMTAYGELAVSLLDELPPGRTPPDTRVFTGGQSLARARKLVCKSVLRNVQAFVVCPLVEASEAVVASDVEATAAALQTALPEHRVAIVHGRMSNAEKDQVMADFRAGDLHVLVATTVIEVGVDVPGARVILVEHAERFGLAQLHQLRGRVGRGGGPSLCLLHTANTSDSEAGQRLQVLAENHDGFAVAQADLELRGPGEMFGTRQSGAPRLRFASFGTEGMRTLKRARKAAEELLAEDPELEAHPELIRELRSRDAEVSAAMADAG